MVLCLERSCKRHHVFFWPSCVVWGQFFIRDLDLMFDCLTSWSWPWVQIAKWLSSSNWSLNIVIYHVPHGFYLFYYVLFQNLWLWPDLDLPTFFNLRTPREGGECDPPHRFSWITSVALQVSTQNFAYLFVHQYYALQEILESFLKLLKYADLGDSMSCHFCSKVNKCLKNHQK